MPQISRGWKPMTKICRKCGNKFERYSRRGKNCMDCLNPVYRKSVETFLEKREVNELHGRY